MISTTSYNSILTNLVSTSLICLVSYPIITFVLTADVSYIVMLIGIISTDLLTKIIKRIIKYIIKHIETQNPPDSESILSSYFLRPKGACDCDILNQNGCQEGKPGMPSGHMAVTVFFLLYLFFHSNTSNTSTHFPKALYIIAATLYAILMGYARYAKRCHNITQIIGGSIVGILTATFLKFIYLQR